MNFWIFLSLKLVQASTVSSPSQWQVIFVSTPVHCTAAYPSAPFPPWKSSTDVCDKVNLTLHRRLRIQFRLGVPKCLYPSTTTGSITCGGELPPPRTPVWAVYCWFPHCCWKPVLQDNEFWEGWFSSFPHAVFVLLHSEKVGRYIGFRQVKEYNLGLRTGMGVAFHIWTNRLLWVHKNTLSKSHLPVKHHVPVLKWVYLGSFRLWVCQTNI